MTCFSLDITREAETYLSCNHEPEMKEILSGCKVLRCLLLRKRINTNYLDMDESCLFDQPSMRVNPYPRANPSAGETTQLAMRRNTFLEFMTRILLAKPDPMIPDETVSVVDNGTPS